MATISLHDEVFATLMQRGNVVATIKLQGVDSIKAVLAKLRAIATECVGLVTLKVRNATQGWSQCKQIKLVPPLSVQREAMQLSLF